MMNKRSISILIILAMAMVIFSFNIGHAQLEKRNINSYEYSNVIDMVVDALRDSSISIALSKVPADFESSIFYKYAINDDDKGKRISGILTNLNLNSLRLLEKLRSSADIDTFIFLYNSMVLREGYENRFPFLAFNPGSEYILFLIKPLGRKDRYTFPLMEQYGKYNADEFLSADNFFTLYEMDAGALCTYCPEDAKYPSEFIYSKDLIDDIKTLIKLQANPSLVTESPYSYNKYYYSMKDDLGKRVFARLFQSDNYVVNMVVDALKDSKISIALCRVPYSISYTSSAGGLTEERLKRVLWALGSQQLVVMEKLRGQADMDSLIYLNWIKYSGPFGNRREKPQAYRQFFYPEKGSEWIVFLESPYLERPEYNVSLMQNYERWEGGAFLKPDNFFTLYEMDAGAFPFKMPELAFYPQSLVHSKELADDIRTIIKLQNNPSLLTESVDSYNKYYYSMKDDLGRRVFVRLFDAANSK